MIKGLIALPIQAVKAVATIPGRLAGIESSLSETQRLLAGAVEQLKRIDEHTVAMRGHTGDMAEHTADLRAQAQDLGDNTDRLVKIASPLERVSRSGRARRARDRAVTSTDATGDGP